MDVNLWSCEVGGVWGGWRGGVFLVEIPKNGEDVCYSAAGKNLLFPLIAVGDMSVPAPSS